MNCNSDRDATLPVSLKAPAPEQEVVVIHEERKLSIFSEVIKGGLITGGISVGLGAFLKTVFNKEAWKHPFTTDVTITAGILDAGASMFGAILYGIQAHRYNREIDESRAQKIKDKLASTQQQR